MHTIPGMLKPKKLAKLLKDKIAENGPESVFGEENSALVLKVIEGEQRRKALARL
jgi:hypothetical protein